LTIAPSPDPVKIIAKAHKRHVVSPPGKKESKLHQKKAKVVKGRWDDPEEIDDSSYSGDKVDEENGKADDGKEDDNNMEPTCQTMTTLQTEWIGLLVMLRKQ
jgi:hypothetical protein